MPKPYLPFVRPMAEADFWRIGEIALESGKKEVDEVCHQIWLILKDRSKQEIRAYYKRLKKLVIPLARAELWDLFRAMFKPHEDEEFDSFCVWIILHGQKFYEQALSDPESLADEKWLRGRYYNAAGLPISLRVLLKIDDTDDWGSYRLINPKNVPTRLPGRPLDVKDLPSAFPRLWERTRKPRIKRTEQRPIRGPLTEDHFWNLIEMAGYGDGTPGENLTTVLSELNKTQIRKFAELYERKKIEAYRWDVWGVAFLLLGGCGDDSFSDFRGWLVLQGKDNYESALADPAAIVDKDLSLESAADEGIGYAIYEAYENITGEEMPTPRVKHPTRPHGDEWSEEDLPNLFPKVAEFLDNKT